MEQKFIQYKADQVNLAKIYRASTQCILDNTDVQDGTLIIGHSLNAKYLFMGYLRGIGKSPDNEVVYEIANAIEDEPRITFVRTPYRVNTEELPCFAATTPDFPHPVVGRIYKCNGELAVMDIGCGKATVNVNSVLELVPYFKENDQ